MTYVVHKIFANQAFLFIYFFANNDIMMTLHHNATSVTMTSM